MSAELPTKNESFADWYARQGIRHFSAGEITGYWSRVRNGIRNSQPPRNLWPNILPTLRVLDDLRDVYGPITITSNYRSEAYNRAVGGAPLSQHREFRACDIQARDATPHEIAATLKQWRDRGKFAGGIGLYATFVHVDTRGTNATW